MRILLIEDDEQSAMLLVYLIEGMGYETIHVLNGHEGLKAAQSQEPSLILLDLRLPGGLDGWETAHHLKSNPHTQHIPVLAVSVEVTPDDRTRALEAGCDSFIAKPINLDCLRKTIQHYMT